MSNCGSVRRVTYCIVVTPSKIDNVIKGQRLRAKKAFEVVVANENELKERYSKAMKSQVELTAEEQR
jgi:hypothetical protein